MRAFGIPVKATICLVVLLSAGRHGLPASLADAELFGKVIRSVHCDLSSPMEQARCDRVIGIKPGDVLTRTGLKAAIQALYDSGSFSAIAALASPEGDGVQLQFQLRRSSYFNRFLLPDDLNLGGRSPAEVMSLPMGERFSAQKLEDARQTVLRYMQDRGYYQAEVTATTNDASGETQIDTRFAIKPGALATIRSLAIRGIPPEEMPAIQGRLKLKEGQEYQRDTVHKRLDALKKYLVGRGYLDAELKLTESYQPGDNSIGLDLAITNFGQVRIVVVGFKVPNDQQRRLLPVLSGEGLRPELLDEGTANLLDYMEEHGYPEALVTIQETQDTAGVRMLRYVIDRGPRVTVSAIGFRGNRAFAEADLLKSIQTQPSRFLQTSAYSVTQLDTDVETLRSLYRSAGYLDATIIPLVELLKDGEKLRITFECNEGDLARVKSISITGNEGLPIAVLAARMRLKVGGPYSPSLAEYDRQAVLAAYNDAGFLQPTVTWRAGDPDQEHAYPVSFQIKEGTQSLVDKIIVVGREQTRDSVIEKRIKLKPDEPLSLGKMLETQQALYGMGIFDQVRVTPQNADSSAPYQNVIVRLQEAKPITLRYGFGYQERERVRGTLELSHLNLLGLGRRVDLRLRGSAIEQAGVLSFQQPQVRFLPVDSYLTFSGNKKKEVSFDSRRLDLSYQYSHPVNNHAWGMLRYSFTNVQVSQVPADLVREETPRNLSTIATFYVNDTRDNYFDPERGFFTSTDLSVTSKLPSSSSASGHYVSLFTQDSYYRRLAGPLLMAASFRFGLIHGFAGDRGIPISERFFAGGGSSLRGFDTDRAGPLGLNNESIGGNALLIGNLELRVPLVGALQLAGFYDGGNVYANVAAMQWSNFSHTVGVGLRVKTPFGPIRIDYGVNLNLSAQLQSVGYKKGHFFLTIGPPF